MPHQSVTPATWQVVKGSQRKEEVGTRNTQQERSKEERRDRAGEDEKDASMCNRTY